MRTLNWPGTQKQLAVVGVVLLLLTAGCLGLGGSDDTGSDELDQPDTPEENGDDPGADDDGTDTGDGLTVDADEELGFDELDSVDEDVDAETLISDALDNLEAIEQYEYEQQLDRTEQLGEEQQESIQTTTVVLDRTETQLTFESIELGQIGYLIDGVYYEQREEYEEEFGSEWVKQSAGGQEEQFVESFDVVNELADPLDDASLTVEGQSTVDGEETYVIKADVDEEAFEQFLGAGESGAEYNSVVMAIHVTQDSTEPVLIEEVTDYAVDSPQGTVEVVDISGTSIGYQPPEITLPEDASDAVDLDDVEDGQQP